MTFFGLMTTILRAAKAARQGAKKPDIRRDLAKLGQGLPAGGHKRVVEQERSERICPECQDNMYSCVCEGVTIDKCLACDSYWFDAGKLKSITGLCKDVPGDRKRSRRSVYQCPDCAVPMTEFVFINPHNLLVDRCPRCQGIYLESREIDRALGLAERKGRG